MKTTYNYDVNAVKNDKTSAVGLSVCHLLYNIINMFFATFLVAHIYTLTTDIFAYVLNVGIYQLSMYVCMFVFIFYFHLLWIKQIE